MPTYSSPATIHADGLANAQITKMRVRKNSKAILHTDARANATIAKMRVRSSSEGTIHADALARSRLKLTRSVMVPVTISPDGLAAAHLCVLRRDVLGLPPRVTLSYVSPTGKSSLNGAILRRGDSHQIEVELVGDLLDRFTLVSFVAKLTTKDADPNAVIHKSNQPDIGGITRLEIAPTIASMGATEKAVFQIVLDPRDTMAVASRTTLLWELQIDDTLGESYSVGGALAIEPDVFHRKRC